VLLIIFHNEYEMQSIDTLHGMFSAGLSHGKWHKLNLEHNATKDIENFLSCELEVDWKPKAAYAFPSPRNQQIIIKPLSATLVNSRNMLGMSSWQIKHAICAYPIGR